MLSLNDRDITSTAAAVSVRQSRSKLYSNDHVVYLHSGTSCRHLGFVVVPLWGSSCQKLEMAGTCCKGL
jgi:hypothetical protein